MVIEALHGVVLGAWLAQGPLPVAKLLQSYYDTRNSSEMGTSLSSYWCWDFGVLVGQGWLEEVVEVFGC